MCAHFQRLFQGLFLGLSLLAGPLALSKAWAATAKVEIDFAKTTGKTANTLHFGLNLFRIYDPATSQDNADYRANLAAMRPGLVRLHSWEMMNDSTKANGWILSSSWDAAKIGKALKGSLAWKPRIMVNIPWGPASMAGNVALTGAQEDAFAAFCASLVKIINIDHKLGATHFEVPNERDELYQGKGADLGRVFVKAARAMKQVDPTIKVGGPAFIQPWVNIVDDFIAAAKDDLDFISYHTYATGNTAEDVQKLFDNAAGLGKIATLIKSKLEKATMRPIEIYHDEYNISWAPPDARMNDEHSAVFDALALIGFAQSDVTGAAAWNEADGWYGKLDSRFAMRPAAHVFALFNKHFAGSVVQAQSDLPAVVAFAVTGVAGPALALVNRSPEAHEAHVQASGLADPSFAQVTRTGLAERKLTATQLSSMVLPPLSVTVVTGQAANPTEGEAGGHDGQGARGGNDGQAAQGGHGGKAQGGGGGRAGGMGGRAGRGEAGRVAGGSTGESDDDVIDSGPVTGSCALSPHPRGSAICVLALAFVLLLRSARRRR